MNNPYRKNNLLIPELEFHKHTDKKNKILFASDGHNHIFIGTGDDNLNAKSVFHIFYNNPELMQHFEQIIEMVKKTKRNGNKIHQ